VTATNAHETLTCPDVQVEALTEFTDAWLLSISG
jgi:hypothetical protein